MHEIHNLLPFLPERLKIKKAKEILANSHDRIEYVRRIINLKQALYQGLVFLKVHRVIKFDQNAWLNHLLM